LLRFGQHWGGGWKVAAVSAIDFVAAAVLMIPLIALTITIISVANWLAVAGGGVIVLSITDILTDFKAAPGESQFYWIYLMVFSTLFPSMLHLIAGGLGLLLACFGLLARAFGLSEKFARAYSEKIDSAGIPKLPLL